MNNKNNGCLRLIIIAIIFMILSTVISRCMASMSSMLEDAASYTTGNSTSYMGYGLEELLDSMHSNMYSTTSSNSAANAVDYTTYQSQWAQPGGDDSWTILIYLCGSDLESEAGMATQNLQEMVAADYPSNVKVVIETGGAKRWWTNGISSRNLDRIEVADGTARIVDEQSGASMGAASTLADFITWGTTTYQSDHYMLIFWNHGSGSVAGAEFDENYSYDSLTLDEMQTAFKTANAHFDVVGFDACLMASLETAEHLADYADYLVASEEVEPGAGWSYTTFLDYLGQNPACTGADLGQVICDSYYEKCDVQGIESTCTLSTIDLSKIAAVSKAFDAMAANMALGTGNASDLRTLAAAGRSAESYGGNTMSEGYTNMVDLADLALEASDVLESTSTDVVDAIGDAVVYQRAGNSRSGAHGLSVFYPLYTSASECQQFAKICSSTNYLIYVDIVVDAWNGGYTTGDVVTVEVPDEEPEEVEPITSSQYDVAFTEEVNSSGEFVLQITSGLEIVSNVTFELYYLDENNDVYVRLGSDNNIYSDWSEGTFTDNFWGTWLTIDGCYVDAELIGVGQSYNLYSIPIYLNGEEYNLRAYYDFTNERYQILGAFKGLDADTGMSSRDMIELQPGDKITFLFGTYDPDTGKEGYAKLDTITYKSTTSMTERSLVDGRYLYRYAITDAFGETYYSNPAQMRVEDGELYVSEIDS